MNLTAFRLISYEEEDQFINGITFSLNKDQAIVIIEFFRSQYKWTEYYFHEIAGYDLTSKQISKILNIDKYWINKKLMFLFTSYSIIKEQVEFEKMFIKRIQSYCKKNKTPSHFYTLWGNDEEIINKNNYAIDSFLLEIDLQLFVDKHRNFDTTNFDYKLEKVAIKEIYFDDSEIDSPIRLTPTPGFWDENE